MDAPVSSFATQGKTPLQKHAERVKGSALHTQDSPNSGVKPKMAFEPGHAQSSNNPVTVRPLNESDFAEVVGLSKTSTLDDAVRAFGPALDNDADGEHSWWIKGTGYLFSFWPGQQIQVYCALAPKDSIISKICDADASSLDSLFANFQKDDKDFGLGYVLYETKNNHLTVTISSPGSSRYVRVVWDDEPVSTRGSAHVATPLSASDFSSVLGFSSASSLDEATRLFGSYTIKWGDGDGATYGWAINKDAVSWLVIHPGDEYPGKSISISCRSAPARYMVAVIAQICAATPEGRTLLFQNFRLTTGYYVLGNLAVSLGPSKGPVSGIEVSWRNFQQPQRSIACSNAAQPGRGKLEPCPQSKATDGASNVPSDTAVRQLYGRVPIARIPAMQYAELVGEARIKGAAFELVDNEGALGLVEEINSSSRDLARLPVGSTCSIEIIDIDRIAVASSTGVDGHFLVRADDCASIASVAAKYSASSAAPQPIQMIWAV